MRIFFLILLTICFFDSLAQDESLDSLFKVDYDTPLTIDLEEREEEEVVASKQKIKKNEYFGYRTKKNYTRIGFGEDVVFELFSFLKEYEGPPPYARDFYWYDYKKRKIVNSLKVDSNNAAVLHGPYQKIKGDQVLEEGFFYKGMKHKRWVRINQYDILQDKKYYWKGWPQESRMQYYDFERKKLREVVPVHFGERDGEYWAFHVDGSVAVRGAYRFDYKVGVWREYYPGNKVKREVQYPEDPFDFEYEVVILKEWDRNGQVIYDRTEFLKSLR